MILILNKERELISIKRYSDFVVFRDSLNLTDRQKEIFNYRYNRGWSPIQISMNMNLSKSTVDRELKIIRSKL